MYVRMHTITNVHSIVHMHNMWWGSVLYSLNVMKHWSGFQASSLPLRPGCARHKWGWHCSMEKESAVRWPSEARKGLSSQREMFQPRVSGLSTTYVVPASLHTS